MYTGAVRLLTSLLIARLLLVGVSANVQNAVSKVETLSYIAICAVVKDQRLDIREWVEYHNYIGVKRIYIWDNGSSPPLVQMLEDYINKGLVVYTYGTKYGKIRAWWASPQRHAYDECLRRFRHLHRWIAFIDADEFIYLVDQPKPDIVSFMRPYENYGALGINWLMFGSSNHTKRPEGGVLVSYVHTMAKDDPVHKHIKTIANTAYAQAFVTPHHISFNQKDKFTVTENIQGMGGPWSPFPSHKKIVLLHYFVKAKDEFAEKVRRGAGGGGRKTMKDFDDYNNKATHPCDWAVPLGKVCCPTSQAVEAVDF